MINVAHELLDLDVLTRYRRLYKLDGDDRESLYQMKVRVHVKIQYGISLALLGLEYWITSNLKLQSPPKTKKAKGSKPTKQRRRQNRTERKTRNIRVPAARGQVGNAGRPRVRTIRGVTTISHTEFVRDLKSDPDFSTGLHSYSVNPGNVNLFRWLAPQANSYELYRLRTFKLRFVTESSTSLNGRIILGADYDVKDPVPADSAELMNMSGSVYGPLWNNQTFSVTSGKFHAENKWMYTRVSEAEPQRNTDGARVYMSASHEGDPLVVGMIFADYTFEFKAPQVPRALDPTPENGFFAKIPAPIPLSPSTPYKVPFIDVEYNNLDAKQVLTGWVFPVGTYLWNLAICSQVETKTPGATYYSNVSPPDSKWGVAAEIRGNTADADGIAQDDLNTAGWWISDGVTPFEATAEMNTPSFGALSLLAGQLLFSRVATK